MVLAARIMASYPDEDHLWLCHWFCFRLQAQIQVCWQSNHVQFMKITWVEQGKKKQSTNVIWRQMYFERTSYPAKVSTGHIMVQISYNDVWIEGSNTRSWPRPHQNPSAKKLAFFPALINIITSHAETQNIQWSVVLIWMQVAIFPSVSQLCQYQVSLKQAAWFTAENNKTRQK